MKILLIVDPFLPVPPRLYGGIERAVDLIVRELIARGHQLTLVAHPDSRTGARLIPYGAPPHTSKRARLTELWQVSRTVWRARGAFDLCHSFGRLAALLPILPLRQLPIVQSYQRELPWRSIETATRIAGDSIHFTACSASVFHRPGVRVPDNCTAIFNPIDPDLYQATARVDADAPLAFLGRIEAIKGAHNAIAIARRAGRRLILAGNRVESGSSVGYFAREIEPHIDGKNVTYIGEVNDAQKQSLLAAAAALLFPIEWEEPFGIVMAESMACGTPVIGFRRGSVPEVVVDGKNGFICDTNDDAVDAVARLSAIDRAGVRADCEQRFAIAPITDQYETLYRRMIDKR